jgi:hypothetical protein
VRGWPQLTGTLNHIGEGTATVLPPGAPTCDTLLRGLASFQAAAIDLAAPLPARLSNRAGVRYLP